MTKYARVSERIMSLLMEFSDLVEQVSIDEAFVDVTGSRELYGSGEEIARKIKARIYGDQRLTASVGVAGNKFVAKVASDLEKPDGLVIVPPGKEKEFLSPLPMTRLWGVGPKTATYFTKMGIERIGQLADTDRAELIRTLGKGGEDLWRLSQGIDDRPVSPEEGYKSIGHETTFERDTADPDVLHDTLLGLTEKVAQRLRSHQVRARTVTVKFREADFTTYTRRTTLQVPADTAERIFPVAQRLMHPLVRKGKLVRLIGIYGSNLVGGQTGQLPLFGPERSKDRDLAAAMDDITCRFGDSAITRASLVPPASKRGKT